MSWHIFQRWFNAAPGSNAEYIIDNRGEKIWISWFGKSEKVSKLSCRYRGYPAGIITFVKEDKFLLTLADIHVPEKYRQRGIGKGLMLEAVKWARKNNFNKIKGTMKAHDGLSKEYIAEWYQRQGFQVDGNKIYLTL